ncbi:Las1-like-domain-containing protein [Thamnocephalis sphaerospora]|uniref:Las1-like-domain-containing protein n=1 Tax=Thamnocephalis sphaerospora TaxID=78915 RepID=A0A4P9Y0A1_9FUNG|nr:Las1-like-domain-containing protein [Thamnocephalis sphaerospora]|eukprot:RKP11190.1 Las1-like-domain-containing protein [Thamnocephalis sphaerospora]
MTLRLPRIVPWSSREEYDQVAQWLFSADSAQRQLAVNRVRAWSSRGKVPHAVDCTATLVELGLLVDRCSLDTKHACAPVVPPKELRLMMTMALIRFVNGFVDAQQQGVYALSVSAVAEQLGIPARFVELRHAGTHDQLPGLVVLRSACTQALRWLYDNYWAQQRSYLHEAMVEMRPVLSEYKELRKKTMKTRRAASGRPASEEARALRMIVGLSDADTFEDTLIPILLEPGFLVPTGKKKRAALPNIQLPTELDRLWRPALARFSRAWDSANFVDALVQAMLEILTGKAGNEDPLDVSTMLLDESVDQLLAPPVKPLSTSYGWTLVAWVERFVAEHFRSTNTNADVPLALRQLDDLIETCLRRPNRYTQHILQHACTLDTQLAEELLPFVSYIQQRVQPIKTAAGQSMALTEDEMTHELKALNGTLASMHHTPAPLFPTTLDATAIDASHTRWSLADTWQSCPIGCLPEEGRMPDLFLPPELDMLAYMHVFCLYFCVEHSIRLALGHGCYAKHTHRTET